MHERRVLSENYFILNLEDLMYLLPDRSEQAIRNQVNYLRKRGYRFKNGDKWYNCHYCTTTIPMVVY